jgi:tyrosine-protein phosphatase YwqE
MTSGIPLCDLHGHLIPGVDDSARTLEESLAALAAMRDQGVRLVISNDERVRAVAPRAPASGILGRMRRILGY